MELTESWATVLPKAILDRYTIAETRNAAALFAAAHPEQFREMCQILEAFTLDVDRIVQPGGNKHFIAGELDHAFREFGWREAKHRQELITDLVIEPYCLAGEEVQELIRTQNAYSGHKIDNVKGRVGLDVEWNPKDGNLDRDFANFRALYDAGVLDVGVIVTRMGAGMRALWQDTIAVAKDLVSREQLGDRWAERVRRTPDDPLGTTTTSNMEKLMVRLERGDGAGCPMLAVAITKDCFVVPENLEIELRRVAREFEDGVATVPVASRLKRTDEPLPPVDELVPDDKDIESS